LADGPRQPLISPEALTIRRVREDDLPGVVRIDARVSRVEKPDYWRDIYERYARRRTEERFFLVAVPREGDDREVLGFVIGEIRAWEFGSEPCGWVFAISVDIPARLVGVGSALWSALLDHFKATGVSTVRTMISRDDHLVMSFFRSQGMRAGPYIEMEMRMDG